MKKKENNVVEFIDVLKKNGQFRDGTEQPKEIKSPEEFVTRFRDLLVSIEEPEQFIKTIELLNTMGINGALVYTTITEKSRGVFASYMFSQVRYDDENYTVSFIQSDENEKDSENYTEFTIPVEKMEGVHGYISNENDGQGDFYCLKICMVDGHIDVVWNC